LCGGEVGAVRGWAAKRCVGESEKRNEGMAE
jgi:hypothetical protein